MTLSELLRQSGGREFSKIPPKRMLPALSIVLDCFGSSPLTINGIISDLLDSTFHDFRVYFINADQVDNAIAEKLYDDDRFVMSDTWPGFDDESDFVLYLPASYRLIRYSIEALVEALRARSANVLRVLASSRSTGVELWRTEFVRSTGSVSAAERLSRKSRTEWWVNADSVGIWAEGGSAPKPFVRRGTSGEHVLEVRVYDARSDAVSRRHEEETMRLRREIRRLRDALSSGDAGSDTSGGQLVRIRTKLARVRKLTRKLLKP